LIIGNNTNNILSTSLRGQQVEKMRDIYDTAWTVVTWLGAAADESDKAIELLEHLAGGVESLEGSSVSESEILRQ
jgi:hypothetical protein